MMARNWVRDKVGHVIPDIPVDDEIPEDEAVGLLEAAGYEILSGKKRIPIHVLLNDEPLQSRLFIDYFVQMEDEVYIVKLAKERKPLELTGSGIRDALLCYQLAYPQAAGILYVDLAQRKINKIAITIEA
jgi:hypothetical protein